MLKKFLIQHFIILSVCKRNYIKTSTSCKLHFEGKTVVLGCSLGTSVDESPIHMTHNGFVDLELFDVEAFVELLGLVLNFFENLNLWAQERVVYVVLWLNSTRQMSCSQAC